ncbi:MAG: hypothetical protein JOZ46_10520 [Candidatus Dormibacteraeota bacterium]|nr:hypothetical protein [Candidatus Dormibacteraeota bacterium]MBV9526233.1 hypothetical protein [Candidatus Dormibacteraeota bacterium]
MRQAAETGAAEARGRGCPFSQETVAACRFYRPLSEHSDAPGAERCRYADAVAVTNRVRRWICYREATGGSEG